jgi:hypothetical protein
LTMLAPRARRVPPGLFPRPVPAPGLGARPLCHLSSMLQWSVMRSPLARRSHPAPSTPVVSSSFEERVRRCLHPLFHHLTVGRWPGDVCWLPTACQQPWPLPPPQPRVWPSRRLRPWHWSGRLGQQLAANPHQGVETRTLLPCHGHYSGKHKGDNTVNFCYNITLQVQGNIIYLWGRSGQLEGVLDVT